MKRALIISAILIGTFHVIFGQSKVTFFGEVRDSLQIPIQYANVMAIDTATKVMTGFGVTNAQGQFFLSLERGQTYQVKISFVGYAPFEKIYHARESNSIPFSITLESDVLLLGNVEIVSEMPVLIQGDTITYKANVFTQGNERKLKDVLEDLPGFEVDADGGVKVQGKTVDKVLVDGKEFFEGDTKMATKNLPANVVDKVQVLQNFNDISPLNRVSNSEDIALNIQLSEDKKNMVFGDLSAGYGPENRYLGHANTFFYNKKTNINLIADANNVGESAFTMRDYFRFSGRMPQISRFSGTGFNVNSGDTGLPNAERNSARDLENSLMALNFNFRPSDAWSFSGFAIGSKSDNTMGSVSNRTYVLQGGDNQEVLTSEQRVETRSALGKLGFRYIPNANLHIDYGLFGKIADIGNYSSQLSEFSGNSNSISGNSSRIPSSVNQQIKAYYSLSDKDILSFEGSYEHYFQDPTYNLVSSVQPFTSLIPMSGNSPYNLNQLKEVRTNRQEAAINYYRILNKTNHLNIMVGNIFSEQKLTSSMFQLNDDGTTTEFNDPLLMNLADFNFVDNYVGLLYKSKLGDLVVSPSLYFHDYKVKNWTQEVLTEGFEKQKLLPALYAKYNFASSHSLTFNYRTQAIFSDIENFAEGIMVNGYNSLFQGNLNLQNSLFQSANLSYFNYNMYNFLNIYGNASYSKRLDDVSNTMKFENFERISSPINISLPNEVYQGMFSIEKRFDKFRLDVHGNWNQSYTNNLINDLPNKNSSFMQMYSVGFSTTLFSAIYLDLGYELSIREYEGTNTLGRFENHQPQGRIEFDFFKHFTFTTNYEYNAYKGNGGVRQFELLDADLRFRKEGSPWEFKVQGSNLFNTTGIRQDSFSESLISTYEYYIQKRYFLLSVMFDL